MTLLYYTVFLNSKSQPKENKTNQDLALIKL